MAVKADQNDQGQQFGQNQDQGQQQQFQSLAQFADFGIAGAMGVYGSDVEQYEKLYEIINKVLKALNEAAREKNVVYSVHKMLKGHFGLNYSGLVIASVTTVTNGKQVDKVTTGHILMVERTGEYPGTYTETINQTRFEIARTPGDALDTKYITSAQNLLSDALSVPLETVRVIDGVLVPFDFDVATESSVTNLLGVSLKGLASESAIRISGFTGMSIPNILKAYNNGKFTINMFFNSEETQYFDQTGMPIRQDICLGLSFKANQQNNARSVNQGDDTVELLRVYGYMDFDYVGPRPQQIGFISPQKFMPNFIITHIKTGDKVSLTPDMLILGCVIPMVLNEEVNWLQSFRTTGVTKKGEIDYNDIGALNIQGNLENNPSGFGARYNTKSKEFGGLPELLSLQQRLVHQDMLISIDVPRAGVDTWGTSLLSYIKNRNDAGAYKRIEDALSALTGGIYQSAGIPLFKEMSNKIHGGFYKNANGERRDIRHLSCYLGVANYITDTNQNPSLISDYTNTLYQLQVSVDIRASLRKARIDDMSRGTVSYKQFYDRLTFNGPALVNIVNALQAAGFKPVHANMTGQNDVFVRQHVAQFMDAGLGQTTRLMAQNNYMGGNYGAMFYNRQFGM